MFVLRKEHLEAFSQVARESYEDRLAGQLRIRFAAQCEELGEEGLRERIADGIERAAKYGITSETDVATFIRYMFGIRPDFDTARQTAWAGEILRDKTLSPADRLAKIKEVARQKRTEETAK